MTMNGGTEGRSAVDLQDENRLVELLRAGDEEAFCGLLEANGPRLLAVATRMLGSEHEAQDCVQEGLLAAVQSIDRFDGRSKLGTWLYSIVVNKCLMRLRSRRRRPECAIEDLLPVFREDGHRAEPCAPWRRVGAESELLETRRAVREAIDRLPEQHRTVLLLRDIEQLSAAEAAAVLGCSANAVKVRLHRARQALREILDPSLRE
jgi:RNA polymerase sigma-70 factor (ECF subfamily)